VVLTEIELGGARTSAVDMLEYNEAGKLIRFEAFGAEAIAACRALARYGSVTSAR